MGKGPHRSLSHNIWHVVDQRAEHQQRALRRQYFQGLVPLHPYFQVLLEGPVRSLLLQPDAAGPHVYLGFRAHKEDLHATTCLPRQFSRNYNY